jgi:uncharacterized membrane-anchored protein
MGTVASQSQLRVMAREAAVKVPEVTAAFWVTKVLTTGMGETASDFLFQHLSHAVTLAVGVIGFTAALVLQVRVRRYVPWVYWLAVVMVSVFGTMAADVVHVGLGVPYAVSTAFFVVVLGVLFAWWQGREKTLSIHSIRTRRRERFYWTAVLATFALGTAAGDLTAKTLNLGYLSSGILFAVVIAVPLVAHRWFRLNAIAAFWFAYIVTRPLGASFSDWFAYGGPRWGTGPITVVLTIAIIGLVGYLTAADRREMRSDDQPAIHPDRGVDPACAPLRAARRAGESAMERLAPAGATRVHRDARYVANVLVTALPLLHAVSRAAILAV